jgi:hypothetical protein
MNKEKRKFEPTIEMALDTCPSMINDFPLYDTMNDLLSQMYMDLQRKKEAIIKNRCKDLGIDIDYIIETKNKDGHFGISYLNGKETFFFKDQRIVTFFEAETKEMTQNPPSYKIETKIHYY